MKKRILPILFIVISLVTLFTVSASADTTVSVANFPSYTVPTFSDGSSRPYVAMVLNTATPNYYVFYPNSKDSKMVLLTNNSTSSFAVHDFGLMGNSGGSTQALYSSSTYITSIDSFCDSNYTIDSTGIRKMVWNSSTNSWSDSSYVFINILGYDVQSHSGKIPQYNLSSASSVPTYSVVSSSSDDFFQIPPVQQVVAMVSGTGGRLSEAVLQNSLVVLPVALIVLALLLAASLIPRVISSFK